MLLEWQKDLSPCSELGGKKGKKTRKKLMDLVPEPTSLVPLLWSSEEWCMHRPFRTWIELLPGLACNWRLSHCAIKAKGCWWGNAGRNTSTNRIISSSASRSCSDHPRKIIKGTISTYGNSEEQLVESQLQHCQVQLRREGQQSEC